MTTYLVALLVGDFVCRTGSADKTAIRVCATPDKLGLTAFALTAAEHQVAFFNRFFGIPYPYEKLIHTWIIISLCGQKSDCFDSGTAHAGAMINSETLN